MRNDFQAAMDQVDAAYLAEYLQQSGSGSGGDGGAERQAAAEEEPRVSMADIETEAADRLGCGDAAFDTQLLIKLYKVRRRARTDSAAETPPSTHSCSSNCIR